MPNSQQTRPLTADEQFRMLFDRTAKLNDAVSALLNPNWGANVGIIPEGHPLYPEVLEPLPSSIVKPPPTVAEEEQAAPVDWQAIAQRRERQLKTVGEQKYAAEQRAEAAAHVGTQYLAAAEQAEAERDGAYRERAHLLALIAAMTDGAVIAPAPDVDEPGWQIAYLRIGGEQCSWHIAPRDAGLFADTEHVTADDPRAQWDGHTTEQKYAYISAHTADLMAECGPACAEQHTETGRCEIARGR